MRIDEIKDIELLRSTLKKVMSECIADVTLKGHDFKKGEWYFTEQDEYGLTIMDDKLNKIVWIENELIHEAFGI